jgi:hypothetical protein
VKVARCVGAAEGSAEHRDCVCVGQHYDEIFIELQSRESCILAEILKLILGRAA